MGMPCRARTGNPRPVRQSADVLPDIDLRLLQAAAVIDVECLPFGEDVQDRLTPLPMAVAGMFDTAKRQMHLGADGR